MSTTKATPRKRSSKTAKDSSTIKARRDRRSARMDPVNALGAPTLSNEQIHGVLDNIAPKVGGLWHLTGEHHQRIGDAEMSISRLLDLFEDFRDTVKLMNSVSEARLRSHERLAHGQLIAMEELVTRSQPELRVILGGCDAASGGSHVRRPHLRVVEGGPNHD